MDRQYREARLGLPFALLGLTGGWLVARLTVGSNRGDSFIAWLLMLFTPVSCGLLGSFLHRQRPTWVLRTLLLSLVAGIANGMMVGMFCGAFVGLIIGLMAGFLFCLPFLPAIFLVTAASRRVGRAASGSLVDGADRRGVWIWTLASIALATLWSLRDPHGLQPLAVAFACLVALFALLVADGFAVHALGRLGTDLSFSVLENRETENLRSVPSSRVIDMGLGDELRAQVEKSAAPYRELDRVVSVVRGDPELARAALSGALRRDLVAIGLAATAVVAQVLWVGSTCRI
jgi:hypothetical protein